MKSALHSQDCTCHIRIARPSISVVDCTYLWIATKLAAESKAYNRGTEKSGKSNDTLENENQTEDSSQAMVWPLIEM